MSILGIDVSTSCTAFCILDLDGNLSSLLFEDFKKCKTFWEKVDRIEETISEMPLDKIQGFFVEESLQKFRPGMSSAKTLTTLSKFNGIVCQIIRRKIGVDPQYLNVNTARKAVGLKITRGQDTKAQVFEFAKNELPEVEWPKKTIASGKRKGLIIDSPYCFDLADAYVVARAGFVKMGED